MPHPTIRSHVVVLITFALLFGLLPGAGNVTAQDDVQREMGVVYGDVAGRDLLLDLFIPSAGETPRAAVILVSYGGRGTMSGPAVKLAQAGYVTITVDYPLLGEPWPAQLDGVQLAVRWMRANAAQYGIDPEHLCAYGFSAGAHLAAMLGTTETRVDDDPALAGYSSRVNCVIDLAGESDLTMPYEFPSYADEVSEWLGGTLEEVPERYRDASPVFHVDEESAPFLLIHGGADTIITIEHSRRMAVALQEAGVDAVWVVPARAGHGDMEVWEVTGPWILTFLEQQVGAD